MELAFDSEAWRAARDERLGEWLLGDRHAVRVAQGARAMGDGDAERSELFTAGLLHDVGRVVAHSGFHRHTQYIIEHADLHGFTIEERGFLAALARYHRRSMPKARHEGFMALSTTRQARVRVLSVLLRLANSLDRGYRGNVTALSARLEEDQVALHFRTDGDPSLEVASLFRHIDVVQSAWGRSLTLVPDSADAVPLPIP
jgi:exopolyphosphatase/guanosine-5'-triphosphate,3'-diphosphate pyrophosphatase